VKAGRHASALSLASGGGEYGSGAARSARAQSENMQPIAWRNGESHVMVDLHLHHSAASTNRPKSSRRRPMQKNLPSKAATMIGCSPPPCRIQTYLQPLCRPLSPHVALHQSKASTDHTRSHKLPRFGSSAANRLGGLGVHPTTTSDAQLTECGFTGRLRCPPGGHST
jgi:hypothetical protein